MLACLNVNHDVRHLWGAGAAVLAAVYYSTNYATKLQHRLLDKFPVLQARIAIYREKRQAGFYCGKTVEQEHSSLLTSVLFALQGQVELSLPTVVNHLLKQPECLQSNTFEKLLMYPFLEWVDESDEARGYPINWEDEIGSRRSGEALSVSAKGHLHSIRLDYVHRPTEMQHLSLYDFVQFTQKTRRSYGQPISKYDDRVRYTLQQGHPQHRTHCMRLRSWNERVIPLYTGPLFPSGTSNVVNQLIEISYSNG
jgi:hypothetical protein